jgi:hypothetical protein
MIGEKAADVILEDAEGDDDRGRDADRQRCR